MPLVSPVSVQVAVGVETTQATVLDPTISPTIYVVPSVGVSLVAELALLSTTVLWKSESAGLVQLRDAWASPPVAVGLVTLDGEVLSMVTVAESVSVPA